METVENFSLLPFFAGLRSYASVCGTFPCRATRTFFREKSVFSSCFRIFGGVLPQTRDFVIFARLGGKAGRVAEGFSKVSVFSSWKRLGKSVQKLLGFRVSGARSASRACIIQNFQFSTGFRVGLCKLENLFFRRFGSVHRGVFRKSGSRRGLWISFGKKVGFPRERRRFRGFSAVYPKAFLDIFEFSKDFPHDFPRVFHSLWKRLLKTRKRGARSVESVRKTAVAPLGEKFRRIPSRFSRV